MKKFDKRELKSPDKFQQELQKGFQWTTQHSKVVGIALIAFLALGAGLSAKSYLDEKNEADIQARYFQAEKKLDEKKAAFQTAQEKPAMDPKKKNAQDAAPAGEKATGDFDKDYGSAAGDLMKIIDEAPKSKAAKMAALNLAEVQVEYKKLPEAQNTLSKVAAHDSHDLLSGLVQTQLGTVQADLNDCNSAVSTWGKVLANKEAKSLHSSVKLKSGLCYETLKDNAKAEKLYAEVSSGDKDSATARAADKYLRLLQSTKKE
jgi:predicted negative regulator of RcsB-dependent stress response